MYTPFSPNTIISSFTNLICSLKFAKNTHVFPYKKSGRYVSCFPPYLFQPTKNPSSSVIPGHPPKVSKAAEWNPLP